MNRLEHRFVNLNPILQHMFLKLDSMERGEEKDHILDNLFHEFDDIVVEARKIFARYGCLGAYPNVHYSLDVRDANLRKYTRTTDKKDGFHVSIPFKLLEIADALIDNCVWISPENLFDEASKPTRDNKDGSQPCIMEIDCLCEKSTEDSNKDNVVRKDDDDLDFEKT